MQGYGGPRRFEYQVGQNSDEAIAKTCKGSQMAKSRILEPFIQGAFNSGSGAGGAASSSFYLSVSIVGCGYLAMPAGAGLT